MRWERRVAWATAGFVVPLVVIYNAYQWTQPTHHDLSDIATALIGLIYGLIAGVVGLVTALAFTRRR